MENMSTNITETEKINKDFEEIESENYSPLEKGRLTQMLWEEIFIYGTKSPERNSVVPSKSRFTHFYLPYNMGYSDDGNGDWKITRRGYDSRHKIWEIDKRHFINADQGGMWDVNRNEYPYFYLSMSECSCVIGSTPDKVVVSHIGFSDMSQIEATIDYLGKNNFDINKVKVIASIGEYQNKMSKNDSRPRATSIDDYLKFGIKKDNILPFEYNFHGYPKNGESDRIVLSGMAKLFISNQFIYTCVGNYSGNSRNQKLNLEGEYQNEYAESF